MNNKFDELAKGLAQSVTRRQALKRFGVGLAGMALACFGLAGSADAKGQDCTWVCKGCKPAIPKSCSAYSLCSFYCGLPCGWP